mmetsp:Transcript_17283/g.29787  ORF Transcript_17283/g.29787 Transcript_17283/m.29787 type:complete len:279 (+) Transcript_17283:237-1073(+)
MKVCQFCFLVLGKQHLLEVLPQHRKHEPLQSIRQNLRLQSSEHQSTNTTLGNHISYHLRITQCLRRTLLIHLHHANGVTARIRHGTSAEPHDGTSSQFAQGIVLLGYLFPEQVVGEEPGVVADEGGTGGGETAVIEGGDTLQFNFVNDIGELSGNLHCCLYRIHRHEEDAEYRRCRTRGGRLCPNGQIFGLFHGIHQRQHTRIGGGISKAREWSLNQSGKDSAIKTRDTAIRVERSQGHWERSSVSVLIVDRSPHPHKRTNIQTHGDGTRSSTAHGAF